MCLSERESEREGGVWGVGGGVGTSSVLLAWRRAASIATVRESIERERKRETEGGRGEIKERGGGESFSPGRGRPVSRWCVRERTREQEREREKERKRERERRAASIATVRERVKCPSLYIFTV